MQENIQKLSELNTFKLRKADKEFKGIVVNRELLSLQGGSQKIKLTVPLMQRRSNL